MNSDWDMRPCRLWWAMHTGAALQIFRVAPDQAQQAIHDEHRAAHLQVQGSMLSDG